MRRLFSLLAVAALALLAARPAWAQEEADFEAWIAASDRLLQKATAAFGPARILDDALRLSSEIARMAAVAPPEEGIRAHAQLIINLLEGSDGEHAGSTTVEELRAIVAIPGVASQDLWIDGFSAYDGSQLVVVDGGLIQCTADLRQLFEDYMQILSENPDLLATYYGMASMLVGEGSDSVLNSIAIAMDILMERIDIFMELTHAAALEALNAEDRHASLVALYRIDAYTAALRGCERDGEEEFLGMETALGSLVNSLWMMASEIADFLAEAAQEVP